jgi:hypothetical protein
MFIMVWSDVRIWYGALKGSLLSRIIIRLLTTTALVLKSMLGRLLSLMDHLVASSLIATRFTWLERLLHYHWLIFLQIVLNLRRHQHLLDLIIDNLFIYSQIIHDLNLLTGTILALVAHIMFIRLCCVVNLYLLVIIRHRPHLLHLLEHLRFILISNQRVLLIELRGWVNIYGRNFFRAVVKLHYKLLDIIELLMILCDSKSCSFEYPWTVRDLFLSFQILTERVN